MDDKTFLEKIKNYLQGNTVLLTAIVTALATTLLLYKWSNTNVVFISSPDNVKLEIIEDLEGPDSSDFNSSVFVPQIPKYLVVHITENYEGSNIYYDQFEHFFKSERGWSKMGYHIALNYDGSVVQLTPINKDKVLSWNEIAYGVKGYNSVTISVAIVGGLSYGFPKSYCRNTMNNAQKANLINTINYYRSIWPKLKIRGHKDFSSKACPCFDIRQWLRENSDIDPL